MVHVTNQKMTKRSIMQIRKEVEIICTFPNAGCEISTSFTSASGTTPALPGQCDAGGDTGPGITGGPRCERCALATQAVQRTVCNIGTTFSCVRRFIYKFRNRPAKTRLPRLFESTRGGKGNVLGRSATTATVRSVFQYRGSVGGAVA
ncbi:hypothetical protein J6590_081483 [Homalodisca vitripennis]|nr:hypothetical protein J6590_081483 [Homalodisca vitripennis]